MKRGNIIGALQSAADNFSPEQARRRRRRREATSLLRGASLGAGAGTLLGLGLMFLFDPKSGSGRRASLRKGVVPKAVPPAEAPVERPRSSLLGVVASLLRVRRRQNGQATKPGNWKPGAQIAAGLTGSAMVAYGARKRGAMGWSIGAFGASLLAGGLAPSGIRRMRRARHTVEVNKTLLIHAPVERVFEFWSRFENFPRFMHNVRAVNRDDHGRSHWVVAGPAGAPVEWDAIVTKMIEHRLLSWKSIPGSTIENAGTVRFTPTTDGSTRIHVQLSYAPPAGKVGHMAAELFGADPHTEMDEDLDRMKDLLESKAALTEEKPKKAPASKGSGEKGSGSKGSASKGSGEKASASKGSDGKHAGKKSKAAPDKG